MTSRNIAGWKFWKVNPQNLIGKIVGLLFIMSAFAPIAGYHLENTNVPVWGTLWNFMLPTGWFSLIAGICLLLLNRRKELKNKWLSFAMIAASISVIALIIVQDVDYFIGLWLGIKGDFDLEGTINVPFFLGVTAIFASLLLLTTRNKLDVTLF